MASQKQPYHVMPGFSGGWHLCKENALRASSTYRTQSEAVEQARKVARREGVELVIHRDDGSVKKFVHYGRNPSPLKEGGGR